MKKQPKMTAIALILSGISGLAYGHGYVSAVENGVAEGRVTLCKFAANGTGEKTLTVARFNTNHKVSKAQMASRSLALAMAKLPVRNRHWRQRWMSKPPTVG